jgi:hypothetical protein
MKCDSVGVSLLIFLLTFLEHVLLSSEKSYFATPPPHTISGARLNFNPDVPDVPET